MRNLLLLGILVSGAFMAGWFTIERDGDRTRIEINKTEIRQDTRQAIDRGREYLARQERERFAGNNNPVQGAGYDAPAPYSPAGFPQNGYPTSNYPQQAYPQSGYPQNGYPQQGYPQTGYPQNGYTQNDYSQSGYPSNGYPGNQPDNVPTYPVSTGNAGYPTDNYAPQHFPSQSQQPAAPSQRWNEAPPWQQR